MPKHRIHAATAYRLSKRAPDLTYHDAVRQKRQEERAREGEIYAVNGIYKKRADKVNPVDSDATDGVVPAGRVDWYARAWERIQPVADSNYDVDNPYYAFITPRTATFPIGQRLTQERKRSLIIGEEIREQEKDLLYHILENREAALAWTFSEMGRVHEDCVPPQTIRTVPHTAWQVKSFPIPKAVREKVDQKILERYNSGVYERCDGPYRNPWFVVKKKNNDYRVVNAAMNINRVTIRDATLPPSADEFSEHVAGMHISSLVDWFSGYDQIPLAEGSRDITAFMTSIGLLRQTTLPQGATNSVAQFVRAGLRILEGQPGRPYMDDVIADGPRSDYGQLESPALPGVRLYVLEHLVNLDKVLLAIECAGATVAGEKSQWCMAGIKVVGYICDKWGRHPDATKVAKVIEWPQLQTPSDVKSFLGLCIYYRVWIRDFARLSGPLYALTKKNAIWKWLDEHTIAMNTLKEALTTAPALVTLDFAEGAGRIVLVIDASPTGWGAILMQEKEYKGKVRRHPSRYESGAWNPAESAYDQVKRETRGLLKALKKFRHWLYGVHFYVESDADTLVAQVKGTATDLPGALVTRWMAWIQQFDFEIKHISGSKNQAADALSRRRITSKDLQEREEEEDIDDWLDAALNTYHLAPASIREDIGSNSESVGSQDRALALEYSDTSERMAQFLINGMRREPLQSVAEYRAYRRNATNYMVRGSHLFKRPSLTYKTPRRIIDSIERQAQLLKAMHDELGHRGRESTYRRIVERYYWDSLYRDVVAYCKTCDECQKRTARKQVEELKPSYTSRCWQKVGLDVVYMPPRCNKSFLVVARDDLSGWVEARAISTNDSAHIAAFVFEDIICRHGMVERITVDGGPENKAELVTLLQQYDIPRVVISAYNPQANGMIERGHSPLAASLSKLTKWTGKNWPKRLPAALWADRTTVHAGTGMTPYEMLYGNQPMLPIELDIESWAAMNWKETVPRDELLSARTDTLDRRDLDVAEAALHMQRVREDNKVRFDMGHHHNIRAESLDIGTLVLRRDQKREIDRSRDSKLSFRWLGPYRVIGVIPDKGTYLLAELDGTALTGTFAANAIVKYYARKDIDSINLENTTTEKDIVYTSDEVISVQSINEDVDYRRGEGSSPRQQDSSSASVVVDDEEDELAFLVRAPRRRYKKTRLVVQKETEEDPNAWAQRGETEPQLDLDERSTDELAW